MQTYSCSFWLDDRHKSRMEFFNTRMGYSPSRNTPAYYAAMYLLTANETLYWRMANCFCRSGLDFSFAILRGISPHNYALYRAAVGLSAHLPSGDALPVPAGRHSPGTQG